ncbi:MAG: 2-oxoacid:acceptor oxidoreductase subunit alpha [Bacteroidia bacterium]|nr:2-oxoacid:acceptor oxidoreductase subunit alpha [Bacteroidia bacterium]MCO5253072.1 2-oxoacid:acceptor oxidoreductase subunit alpha [Bacteroidota bacterium]
MTIVEKELNSVVIKFVGDSGDGMQVSGNLFTSTSALAGNDIATFPDFPAEIRAPIGTVAGVSGFQIQFGNERVYSPGDSCDVLVAMNAAALKSNLNTLKSDGIVIANSLGFDAKNLKLAGYPADADPLGEVQTKGYKLINVDLTKVAKETLSDKGLGNKEIERGKNMVALGLVCWMYQRPLDKVFALTERRFGKKGEWAEWNKMLIQSGWNFGETIEVFNERYVVKPAPLQPGKYRGIAGNEALALGFVAAAHKAKLRLFLGAYPITPASDVLHELAKHKKRGVDSFMAEDEIAAICAAIGASYGGSLGLTVSSGPGMALKAEAIGLAVSLEIPLVICNVQRGGPSTGLPTKTEQADLFQALFGRNGECPMIVLAAGSPKECFEMAFQAAKLSLEHVTPVILLSDGYIANGAEPWRFPSLKDLPEIKTKFAHAETDYQPYARDENYVRQWAVPGMKGIQHRIGGLEKEDITGNVSYDPDNHQKMTELRQKKVDKVVDFIPELSIMNGPDTGKLLVLGWGSTLGAITTAVLDAHKSGINVSQAHLRYLNPFPKNLEKVLANFDKILVPELNMGQLSFILKSKFNAEIIQLNKVKGKPFLAREILEKIIEINHGS